MCSLVQVTSLKDSINFTCTSLVWSYGIDLLTLDCQMKLTRIYLFSVVCYIKILQRKQVL